MDITTAFAYEEIRRYWRRITGETACGISLSVEKTEENPLDDAYSVKVKNGNGVITGTNARSVLLGVYGFLRRLGCFFLYPTEKGESIVRKAPEECSVDFSHCPSRRHRGIAIEGTVSGEDVLNIIDWAPKAGFNAYFIQFRTGYEFFRRRYSREWDPLKQSEPYDDAVAEVIHGKVVAAIRKRGLVHHAVGHGWTCESIGYPSRGWYTVDDKTVAESVRRYLAEVGGERKFYKDSPLNTNLCYGRPEVRKMLVDNIAAYALEHRVDLLHIWLADNYNNFCTCPLCSELLPSEHYVILLNEIDRRLTELGLETKLVFLIYFELLIPPKKVMLKNKERFVMMFAPITRTYMSSFQSDLENGAAGRMQEYIPNRFVPPVDINDNLSYLYAWQKLFDGDSFIFDYPLMWDCCKEFGGIRLAQTIYGDVASLKKLGLNGYLSCQVQRAFFPTGFCMYVLGRMLDDDTQSYDALREEYFAAAFGTRWPEIYDMLSWISSQDIYAYMRHEISSRNPNLHARLAGISARIAAYGDEARGMAGTECGEGRKNNLETIVFFLEFMLKICAMLSEKTKENPDAARLSAQYEDIRHMLFFKEDELGYLMDTTSYVVHVHALMTENWT
jgi:hypothetical protein